MRSLLLQTSTWLFGTILILLPSPLFAQLDKHLITAGKAIKTAGESGPKLPELVGKFINLFLSVLGIIFLALVVYAGYLWMTDAGGGDKVKKAKSLLGTAIIGLIIVISAYAISSFVIERIQTGVVN